jgi:hypothetical protein
MRRIVIYGLSGSTIFSTLFHKQPDFQKKKLLDIKHVLIFSTGLPEKVFSL